MVSGSSPKIDAIGSRDDAAMPRCAVNDGQKGCVGYSGATGRAGSRYESATGSVINSQDGVIAVADARLAG
jgi:hypothetical protein